MGLSVQREALSFRRSLPGEPSAAFGGFCIFRDLGPMRTLRDTAAQAGVTPATCSTWKSRYHWTERVRRYDEVMSHAAVQQAKATLEEEMVKEYTRRKAQRLQVVDKLRKVAEEGISSLTAVDFREKPTTLINVLKYIDATEDNLFKAVKDGEDKRHEEETGLNLEELNDDQLEELFRLSRSIAEGGGEDRGGDGEEEAEGVPAGGLAPVQSGDPVPEQLAPRCDVRSPGGGVQEPDSPFGDQPPPENW